MADGGGAQPGGDIGREMAAEGRLISDIGLANGISTEGMASAIQNMAGEQPADERYAVVDEIKGKDLGTLLSKDKERRLEKYYTGKGLRRWDGWFAGAETRTGISAGQEFGRKSAKVGIKTGIYGGLSLITAGVMGGFTAPILVPVALGALAGGGVRLAYEGIRTLAGKERRGHAAVEFANEKVIERAKQLTEELAQKRTELFLEGYDATEIEENPEIRNLAYDISEMMLDDTARRVKKDIGPDGKVTVTALRRMEEVDSGGKDKEGVINVGKIEKGLRGSERRWETGGDLLAAITTIAASVFSGIHAAKEAGQTAAQNAGEALKHGKAVGSYDFDGKAIPDSAKAHMVKAIENGVRPFFEKSTHIWHDSLGNLQAAIGKVTEGAIRVSQLKALIGLGITQAVTFFAGRIGHKDVSADELKDKARVEDIKKKIFTQIEDQLDGGVGAGPAGPDAEAVAATEEGEDDAEIIGINKVIYIERSSKIRDKLGIPNKFGNYELFHVKREFERNDKKYVELCPLKEVNGQIKLVQDAGLAHMLKINLEDTKNVVLMGKSGFEYRTIEDSSGDVGGGTTGTIEGALSPNTGYEPKPEITEKEREEILARLERDKNLPKDKIDRYRKAADWVTSRLSEEQIAWLNVGEENERDKPTNITNKAISDKRFRELAKIVLKNEIVTHHARVSNRRHYPDLDGECSIGLFRMAGIYIDTNNPDTFVAPGGSVDGKVMVDTSGKEGVWSDFNMQEGIENTSGGADHHDPFLSGRENSATALVYEVLTGLGMIDEDEHPYLRKMVEFVTKFDNAAYAGDKEVFLNSYKTMVGLGKYMKFGDLAQFFKDERDTEAELSDTDLKKYGLKWSKMENGKPVLDENKQPIIVNRSLEHKDNIASSLKELERIEAAGLIVETEKFGKIVVDFGAKMKLKWDAIRAEGYDTYLLWNRTTDSFFLSSKESFSDDFQLNQGKRVRDNMWTKGLFTDGELKIKLHDVLEEMASQALLRLARGLKEFLKMKMK